LKKFPAEDILNWQNNRQVFSLAYRASASAQPKLAAAFFDQNGELLFWKGGQYEQGELYIEILPFEVGKFPVNEVRLILDQSQEYLAALSELKHRAYPPNPLIYGQVHPF